jgi:ectoine hydroxylase-related dioxygenase (phytanoyl-CoA dioxygenase family)
MSSVQLPHMTGEQRYLFDLHGYLVLPGVLKPDELATMQREMTQNGPTEPQNNPEQSRFRDFLGWGPLWRNLIDHPAILPVLYDLLGPKFRIDHAYGMAMRESGERGGEGLHHEAGMFNHGAYYVTHRDRMHNGLIVVSWALTDAPLGSGGFCCIPGSHKALFPTPKGWHAVEGNPVVKQVPMKAGDVVVFTEALTHGTMAWKNKENERRAVLLKYCPSYLAWVNWPMQADKFPDLTARQKLILAGPGVYPREAIPPDPA